MAGKIGGTSWSATSVALASLAVLLLSSQPGADPRMRARGTAGAPVGAPEHAELAPPV